MTDSVQEDRTRPGQVMLSGRRVSVGAESVTDLEMTRLEWK